MATRQEEILKELEALDRSDDSLAQIENDPDGGFFTPTQTETAPEGAFPVGQDLSNIKAKIEAAETRNQLPDITDEQRQNNLSEIEELRGGLKDTGAFEAFLPRVFKTIEDPESVFKTGKFSGDIQSRIDELIKVNEKPNIPDELKQENVKELVNLQMEELNKIVNRGLASGAADLLSLVGRPVVAAIDNAAGISGFLESMAKTEAGDESGGFAKFMENIIRAPDTVIGFFTGGATAKIAKKLAKLKSPAANKALRTILDAFQQGTLSGASEELEEVAEGNEAEIGRFAKNVGIATTTDVGAQGLFGILKGAARRTLKAFKSAPEAVDIPAAALEPDAAGFQATPAQITDDPGRKSIEAMAQVNPDFRAIPDKIKQQNLNALQENIAGVEGVKVERISPTELRITQDDNIVLGKGLEESFEGAQTGISQEFAAAEGKSIFPIKDKELPQIKIGEQEISPEKVSDPFFTGARKITPAETLDITKNQSSLDIKDQLKSVGFEGGQLTGNEKAAKKTVNFLRQLGKNIDNAKTVDNLIEQRRKIQSEIFNDANDKRIFETRDIKILNETYAKINDRIAEQIKDPKMRDLWREANRSYSNDRKILEGVAKGVGFKSESTKAETYIKKIGSKIGIENLEKLKALSEKSPSMKGLFSEVKRGFYNDFVKSLLKKDVAQVSLDKFQTQWNQMDNALKKIIVPKETIKRLDHAHAQIKKQLGVNVDMLSGSRTAPLLEQIKAGKRAAVNKVLSVLYSKPVIEQYYKSGNFPSETIVSFLGQASRNKKLNNMLNSLDNAATEKKRRFLIQRINAEYARMRGKED